jgi:zinc/manganese transport system substrate-binding protein
MLSRRNALAAAAALAALLCAGPAAAQEKVKVVASFSILADFVKNVGGDRLDLVSLVGANGDAHVYAPSPADAKKIADAKLVFVNGLGFEGWMSRLVKASGTKATVVTVTKGMRSRKMEGGQGHAHEDADPHAWQSIANAKVYVGNIRDALIAADPAGQGAYETNATGYLAKLDALETEVKATIGKIPADRRRIITTHDAFGYFHDAYGIDFIAPVGVSTDSEASARDIARIITQIKKQKIPAVFMENISDPRLVKRIADETGAKIGGTLFSDALSDDKGPAPSYLEMIRNNIRQFSTALMS